MEEEEGDLKVEEEGEEEAGAKGLTKGACGPKGSEEEREEEGEGEMEVEEEGEGDEEEEEAEEEEGVATA